MKTKITVLLIAALMLTCASCGNGDSSASSQTESRAAESSSAAEADASSAAGDQSAADSSEADSSEAEAPTLFGPMVSAAQELSCLDTNGKVYETVCSNDCKIAVSCFTANGKSISIADPVKDKFVRSFDTVSEGETLIGLRPDKSVITLDCSQNKFFIYDENSSTPRELEYPKGLVDPKYDFLSDTLYGYERSIVSIDLTTGETKEIVPVDTLTDSISAVAFSRGIYAADRLSTELGGSDKAELFRIDGAQSISALPVYNCKNCYLLKDYAVYEDGSDHTLSLFSTSDGSSVSSFVSPVQTGILTASEYSDYILSAASNIDGDSWETYIKVIDPMLSECGEFHFENNMLYGISICPTHTGRWFLAVTRGEGDAQRTSLIMVDPALAENRTPLEKTSLPVSKEAGHHEIDSTFSELRKKADELEEKYGIRILAGEEILDLPSDLEYDLDPLTVDNYNVEDSLVTAEFIEKMLSAYPEDFFKKFVSPAGGGLRIAVVNDIVRKESGTGDIKPCGLTWQTGAWINIALNDSGMFFYQSVLHHELWHAVEMLVARSTPIDEEAWAKLDPEGFEYSNDIDAYRNGNYDSQNTLEGDGEAWFIRDYSKVNSHEDRATVIEQVMTADPSVPESLVSNHPKLLAKAEFIAEWIKPYFGYVYFEDRLNGSASDAA